VHGQGGLSKKCLTVHPEPEGTQRNPVLAGDFRPDPELFSVSLGNAFIFPLAFHFNKEFIMKNRVSSLILIPGILIIALICFGSMAHAGLTQLNRWSGMWQSQEGDAVTIFRREDVMDIHGSDNRSTYHGTCIADRERKDFVFNCVGDGSVYSFGTRFIFRSILTFDSKGGLIESWESNSREGTQSGKTEFTQMKASNGLNAVR
jgi:hypothetical protein